MSKLVLLLLLAMAAMVAAVSATTGDAFESELALEAPELVEGSADSFLTLSSLADAAPENKFAALEQEQAQAEEEQTEEAAEQQEEEPALLEAASVSEVDATADESVESSPVPWHRNPSIQPVNRNGGDIQCLDGDCARGVGVKHAKVGSHPTPSDPKPATKLDIALGAVKEEIMVRAKELHLEKEWSAKVTGLIDEYQQKLAKVTTNIAHLRTQTKALLRKKKQIQNVQVQNKLRAKLQLAQADLNRLQKQMEHIAGKENEFSDTEKQLKATMNALKNSLLKLRGQETQKLAIEGIE